MVMMNKKNEEKQFLGLLIQMGRKQSELSRLALFVLSFLAIISCFMVYLFFSASFKPSPHNISSVSTVSEGGAGQGDDGIKCCKGIEHLELWGDAVKWGADFKVNSSEECCMACKDMCRGAHGSCLCDSWVFCGDKQACGPRFGECWLKKQKDTLEPDRRESGDQVIWTSGLVFGKGEGIVGLETEYGVLHIKLLSDCAPLSVAYILELLALRHCPGCHFYRAESRGAIWDSKGNHIEHATFGPPFALIQGTLEAHQATFRGIPPELCSEIRRGSVAWVSSGPEFFISLANHKEWKTAYTVFGFVLPEDMEIAERIAQLQVKPEVWSNINVSVLQKPVLIKFKRLKTRS